MTSTAPVTGQSSNTLATSSSCSRRTKKRPSPSSPPPEARDWTTLPQDALLNIFLRLDFHDILWNVEVVCRDWRRVAVEEPTLWRRVDMTSVPLDDKRIAVCDAVDRSKGLLEAFTGPGDDYSLLYIADRAPSLKSLHLWHAINATDEILMLAIPKFPLLQYLEISPASSGLHACNRLFQSVCKACPLLKSLKITFTLLPYSDFDGRLLMEPVDGDLYRIPMMCELQSLELFNYVFNNEQLSAILDNCPLLESLRITGHYVGGEMDEQLRAKCARVKNLSFPFELNPRDEDFGYSSSSEEDESYSGYSSFSKEDEFDSREEDSGYEDEFNPSEGDSGYSTFSKDDEP